MGDYWRGFLTYLLAWGLGAVGVMSIVLWEKYRHREQAELAALRRKMEEQAKARATEN